METIRPIKVKLVMPKPKYESKRMSAFEEREHMKNREKILESYFNLKDPNYPVFINPSKLRNSKLYSSRCLITPKVISIYKPLKRHEYKYRQSENKLRIQNYEFKMNPIIHPKSSNTRRIIHQSIEENKSQQRNLSANLMSTKNLLKMQYQKMNMPKSSYHFKRINIDTDLIFKDYNDFQTQRQCSIKGSIHKINSPFNHKVDKSKKIFLRMKEPSSTSTNFHFVNENRKLQTSSLPKKNIEQPSNEIIEPSNNFDFNKINEQEKVTSNENINSYKECFDNIPNNQLNNIEIKDSNNQVKLIRKIDNKNFEETANKTEFQKEIEKLITKDFRNHFVTSQNTPNPLSYNHSKIRKNYKNFKLNRPEIVKYLHP